MLLNPRAVTYRTAPTQTAVHKGTRVASALHSARGQRHAGSRPGASCFDSDRIIMPSKEEHFRMLHWNDIKRHCAFQTITLDYQTV